MSRLPSTVKSSPSLLLPLTPGLDNYAPSSLSFSWCLAPTPWSKHSSPRAWLWSFYGRHSQPSWWRCEFTRASPFVNSFSVRCTPLRTRRRGQHGLQWRCADDYTIVIAWALAVCQATVSYIVSVKTWQGYHVYDIPDFSVDERVVAAKYDIANQLLYNPILALVKASIVFLPLASRGPAQSHPMVARLVLRPQPGLSHLDFCSRPVPMHARLVPLEQVQNRHVRRLR
jgi:hypothetical protein